MRDNQKMSKLILCFIPTNTCNLKCEYCIVSQVNDWERNDIDFKYSVEHIIEALSQKRLNGACYVNLTAQGETLLYKDIIALTKGLLEEGHHVEIVTNGLVSKKIDEILTLPENLLENLFFKISYHYNELQKYNLLNKYWENVNKIKKSPASFTVELMPYDEIIKDIDNIKNDCIKNIGAECHLTVGRNDKNIKKELLTKLEKEEYVKIWSQFKSNMFDLKMKLFSTKRKEFCYAGKWSLLVDISSGEASQCYGRMNTQNIFKDLEKPIDFRPVGYSCTQPFCFNGHAHIAWGIIPDVDYSTYYDVRNRECKDCTNWIKESQSCYFKQKLKDNNEEYTTYRKIIHTITNPFYLIIKMFHDIPGIKRKLKKIYKIFIKKV